MFHKISAIFLFIICFNTNFLEAESPKQNCIYMVSLGADPIGGGRTYVLDDKEGLFDVRYLSIQEGVLRGDGFALNFNGGVANSWVLECVTPYQQKMTEHIDFVGAQAYPGQSPRKPGMRIVRAGSNATNITGSFQVLEWEATEQGEILALAVDFRQVCNGAGVLLGSIRYQSSIPISADLYTLNDGFPLEISMESQNDWVGQGKKYHYKMTSIPFFAANGALHFGADGWGMSFCTPDGQPLQKGKYLDARRYAFRNGHPGIDISGHGRGCNQIDGSFEVLEIEYDPYGRIAILAMDFKQCCDGRGLLKGSVRFNSSIPTSDKKVEVGKLEIRMQGKNSSLTGNKLCTAEVPDARPLLPMRDMGINNVLRFDVEGYTLTFVAPQDQPSFKVGKYLDASRFPFQAANQPGMDLSGHGFGCNTVVGDFEILEIAFNEDNAITRLALDFVHYCEWNRLHPTHGTVRYNSNIPHINQLVPPEKKPEEEPAQEEPSDEDESSDEPEAISEEDCGCGGSESDETELDESEPEEEERCETCSDDDDEWWKRELKKLKKKLKKLKVL